MICKNCGTKFESPFCPECGARSEEQVNQTTQEKAVLVKNDTQPKYSTNPYQAQHYQQPTYPPINQVIINQPVRSTSGIAVAKTIIGIICMVSFLLIILFSCSATFVAVLDDADTAASSGAGMFIAMFYLVAGIISTAGRSSRGASLAAMIMFIISAIIGFAALGAYYELIMWALLASVFALVYLIFFLVQKSEVR